MYLQNGEPRWQAGFLWDANVDCDSVRIIAWRVEALQIVNRGIMFLVFYGAPMADEEYVRKLRQKLDLSVRADQEQTKKENREADIIKAQAPKDWSRLKEWVRQASEQVNDGRSEGLVEYEQDSIDEFKVSCRVGTHRKETKVTFLSGFGGLFTCRGGVDIQFECSMQGSKAVWTTNEGHEVCTIESMGMQILNSVI